MARTGNFGGFAFDEEVFTGMMQEADYWTTPIIASGIVQQDSSIMDLRTNPDEREEMVSDGA